MPDKFASMRAKQASRGKCSGKFAALSASKSSAVAKTNISGGAGANCVDNSDSGSGAGSGIRRKSKIRTERQESLFADLDQAESLAMEILTLASTTVRALSDAASCTDDGNDNHADNNSTSILNVDNDNTKRGDGTNNNSRLSKLMMKCDSNGIVFMEKVKKIHSLVSPHAGLVVPYRNHAVDIFQSDTTTEAKNRNSGKKRKLDDKDDAASSANSKPLDIVDDTATSNGKKETRTLNMYAARMEKKLALEKRDTLKELLKIEREDDTVLR